MGLWNLWLPPDLQQAVKEMGELGTGLTNREWVDIYIANDTHTVATQPQPHAFCLHSFAHAHTSGIASRRA